MLQKVDAVRLHFMTFPNFLFNTVHNVHDITDSGSTFMHLNAFWDQIFHLKSHAGNKWNALVYFKFILCLFYKIHILLALKFEYFLGL